jgi:hypothetical protein
MADDRSPRKKRPSPKPRAAGKKKSKKGTGSKFPQLESIALELECRALLALLRKRCPGLLPEEPLEPGAVSAPIPVKPTEARTLVAVAAQQSVLEAVGARVPSDPQQLPSVALWQEGPDALMIDVAQIDVRIVEGLITVAIPVICDQLPRGRGVVEVDFVVGTPDRPTGLLAAATEPRGERVVVRRWGDALTALAWQSVLGSIGGVAAAAGVDRDGASLIPTALTATRAGLGILVQARHQMDRVRPGRVVTPRTAVRMSRS